MAKYVRGQEVPGTGYVYIRRLDEGGMCEIYEVESKSPKKRCVMKLPLAGMGTGDEERLRSMTRALAVLRHDNIVEVLDGGVTSESDGPRPFFMMPRMSGRSLEQAIEEWGERFDIPTTAGTMIPVLEALVHAHSKGIVHGNLKPENIFLEKEPDEALRIKVIDFGIGHVLAATVAASTEKKFTGTIRFASPEQIRGEDPTDKTDVHAVGLIMFRMLTSRGMFDEVELAHEDDRHARVAAVVKAIMNDRRPRMSFFVDIPAKLDDLVARMTDPDPSKRPSPQFVIDDLRSIVGGGERLRTV